MATFQTISGYFKQLTGEIVGSQALADEGRREVAGRALPRDRRIAQTVLDRRSMGRMGMPTMAVPDEMDVAAADEQRAGVAGVRADADPQFRASHAGGGAGGGKVAVSPARHSLFQEELKLYCLVPVAAPEDPRWGHARSHGEVVVRARSSADARIVASVAVRDFREIEALPVVLGLHAFRDERLYAVVVETSSIFPTAGPREVVARRARIGNARLDQD